MTTEVRSVFKFGGSSVKDADSIRKCAEIILASDTCRLVVVSATQNTTNQLELLYSLACKVENNNAWGVFRDIMNRHDQIAEQLGVRRQIAPLLKELALDARAIVEKLLLGVNDNDESMDHLYSIGERLSSLIISRFLAQSTSDKTVKLWDARSLIKTNSNFKKAAPLVYKSKLASNYLLKFLAKEDTIVVTQGFIGSNLNGRTTTLGREGSDYSATLLGEIIGATEVHIMTDVPGIATCDPRVIPSAKFLSEISYDQATLMAQKGAKILFARTLLPAKRSEMIVYIGSTKDKLLKGTCISKKSSKDLITGITIENDIVTIVGEGVNQGLCSDIESLLTLKSISYELWEESDLFLSFKVESSMCKETAELFHQTLLS